MNKMKNASFWERNKQTKNYLLRHTIFRVLFKIARAVLLFGLCFLILQPLFNKISVSFMAEQDLYDTTIISIPKHFTTYNYWLAVKLMDYWRTLANTVGLALIVSVFQIISCTLVGYGFARYKFPLKNFWFALVILVIVVPPQTMMASLYVNFRYFDVFGIIEATTGEPLNLLGTPIPYILMSLGCMGLKCGLYIYMIRQYFRGIPKELEEAAYVDGYGKFKTFVRIMLPDAKPILTSCFLFAFVWQWTDTFYTGMFLREFALLPNKLSTLTGALGSFLSGGVGESTVNAVYGMAVLSTGTLLVILPLILIYLVAQKGFVESLSQSGLKM